MKTITCLIGLFLLFQAPPAKAQSDGDEIPLVYQQRNHGRYRKLQPNGPPIYLPAWKIRKYRPRITGNE